MLLIIQLKNILLTICGILFFISSFGQGVKWHSFEEAQELNKKEPRKMMVDVYTKWCGPCKMMMKQTFGNQWVAEYINKNYYAVKFNAEGPDPITFQGKLFENPSYMKDKPGRNATHQLTHAIDPVNGRIAYPTIVFIDEGLNLITPVQGFQQPKQFEPMLKFIAEDSYKTIKWPDYMAAFKSDLK
jgi:thioredoxin-related protein